MKKEKPDLISLAELARQAGVTAPSVTVFVRKQEAAGHLEVISAGRGRKLVDKNHPAIRDYIQNTRPGVKSDPVFDEQIRKLENRLRFTRLKTAALREKYMPRDAAFTLMDKYQSASDTELRAMIGRIIARIKKESGVLDAAKESETRALLERAVDDALISGARLIADFKRDAVSGAVSYGEAESV